MTNLALGAVALVMLLVVAILLFMPMWPGAPPVWLIVAVLVGLPVLGMLARRVIR